MFNKLLFLFGMALLEFLAASVLLLQASDNTVTQVIDGSVVIFEDRHRIAYCLIGALSGAFVSVAVFPPKTDEKSVARRMGTKFGCSAIGGIVLTPKAIEYFGWEPNADNLIFSSFLVATIAVSLLHTVLPMLERKITEYLTKKLGS